MLPTLASLTCRSCCAILDPLPGRFCRKAPQGRGAAEFPWKVGFDALVATKQNPKKNTETNCWMYTSHFPRLALCQGSRAVVQSGGQFMAAYVSKLLSEAASMNWLGIPTCLCFGRNGINQWNLKIAKEVLRASLTLQLQHAAPAVKKPHLLIPWRALELHQLISHGTWDTGEVGTMHGTWHCCVHSVWPHGISATKCRVSWQMGHLPLMPWGVAWDLPGALAGIFHSAQTSTFTFIPRKASLAPASVKPSSASFCFKSAEASSRARSGTYACILWW